jgi:hypothetical protein
VQQGLRYHRLDPIRLKEVAMRDIEALIRERAYLIWEKSGKPAGRDRDHWFQAAREIEDEQSGDPLAITAVETMPPSIMETMPTPTVPKNLKAAAAVKRMPFKKK